MTFLIEVPLDGGASVVMEIDAEEDRGIVRSSRPGEIVATAALSLDTALQRLKPMAETLVTRLRDVGERPDEIGIEFGLKMSMEAGLVVAHTSGEANFKVTMQWKRA
jgi:Trypsin-co-occurring domain 1